MSNTKLLNVDEAEAEIISFEMEKTVVMGLPHEVDEEMAFKYMEDTSSLMTWDKACELVARNQRFFISSDGQDGFLVGLIQLENGGVAYLMI